MSNKMKAHEIRNHLVNSGQLQPTSAAWTGFPKRRTPEQSKEDAIAQRKRLLAQKKN